MLEPAWTIGDRDLLERLAANLVSNAIRHNIVGGRIEVSNARRVEERPPHRRQHRPARPGRRAPAASSNPSSDSAANPSDGVGLGLAIVQAIADAHDATVTAEARPGGGLGIDVALRALD